MRTAVSASGCDARQSCQQHTIAGPEPPREPQRYVSEDLPSTPQQPWQTLLLSRVCPEERTLTKGSGTVCPARLPQPQVASKSPEASMLTRPFTWAPKRSSSLPPRTGSTSTTWQGLECFSQTCHSALLSTHTKLHLCRLSSAGKTAAGTHPQLVHCCVQPAASKVLCNTWVSDAGTQLLILFVEFRALTWPPARPTPSRPRTSALDRATGCSRPGTFCTTMQCQRRGSLLTVHRAASTQPADLQGSQGC